MAQQKPKSKNATTPTITTPSTKPAQTNGKTKTPTLTESAPAQKTKKKRPKKQSRGSRKVDRRR
jgi:hypothetical protein